MPRSLSWPSLRRAARRFLPRALLASSAGLALLIGGGLALPGCKVGYVVRSAWFQGELLASREPIDKVRAERALKPEQLRALDIIADVKAFGESMGLAPTKNYGTVAWGWDREIWNVTACDPVAFRPETWWFPIVGRVPYLGYFRKEDADETTERLAAQGLDVYARTAGAYSTLGWFRDPILPSMLSWDEFDLADGVMHELAHATIWVPGSVAFNESFANFVGEEGAFRYIEATYGAESTQLATARADFEDLDLWRDAQIALASDLDAAYKDAALTDEQKLAKKAALFAAFPSRVEAMPFHSPDRFVAAAGRGEWNNARLVGFQTYNSNRPWFEAILARNKGDLLAFMKDVDQVARADKDPFAALERAASGSATQKSR